MPLSLEYAKGDGAPSYFPLSAITDRLEARNQLKGKEAPVGLLPKHQCAGGLVATC